MNDEHSHLIAQAPNAIAKVTKAWSSDEESLAGDTTTVPTRVDLCVSPIIGV